MTDPVVNEDFVDIVSSFTEEGVVFLVVGAYALAAHGFPRTTGDIDLLVEPTAANASVFFVPCSRSVRRSLRTECQKRTSRNQATFINWAFLLEGSTS